MSAEKKVVEEVSVSKKATVKKKPEAMITEIKTDIADRLQRETAFAFEYTDPEDGKVYAGDFKARRLTIGQFGQMQVHHARLNGGQMVDPVVDQLHYEIAYCRATLVEFPEWWKPEEFWDGTVLQLVFDHVRQWESSFRPGSVG